MDSYANIAEKWHEYGRDYARYPSLWDSANVLSTLGPQMPMGTRAWDFSGRNNHGTLVGATHLPTWANATYRGQSFRAMTFDGTEDRVSVPDTVPTSVALSVSVWLNVATGNPSGGIFCKRIGNGGYVFAELRLQASLAPVWYIGSGVDWTYAVYSLSSGIPANTWTHLVVSQQFGSATVTATINGLPVSGSWWGDGTIIPAATIGKWIRLGTFYESSGYYQGGLLADARLYNRVLKPSEHAILARHPLAAYEIVKPKYWIYSSPAASSVPYSHVLRSHRLGA